MSRSARVVIWVRVLVVVLLLLSCSIFYLDVGKTSREKSSYWSEQRKGANVFNLKMNLEDIRQAKKYGIKFIRLAPNKWVSSHPDFLIGDIYNYRGIIREDLKRLRAVIDACYKEGMPVVLTMLSLPGSRSCPSPPRDRLNIWTEKKYQLQSASLWQDLAKEFKSHPGVVGYNILNEPHPERMYGAEGPLFNLNQEHVQNLLFEFYDLVIKAIRKVDRYTPIILDSSAYADPNTFKGLKCHEDRGVLYSFHMYEPFAYTNYKLNGGNFSYPGEVQGEFWDKFRLCKYMDGVVQFQKCHNIASNRIVVGEFGGNRRASGLERYFRDLIDYFSEHAWHFAFYAFREDCWEGMDYELGCKALPQSYWDAIELGQEPPQLERKDNHPAFSVIKEALNK